jgi:ATP-dependent Clp protease ATP-binding subunit ClpA/ATP-dependent Clp protease ATP-binding subunit ClpC
MTASFTVAVYQRKSGNAVHLTTVGLGPLTRRGSGAGARKAEEKLLVELKKTVSLTPSGELGWLDLKRGIRLQRVRLEVTLKDAERRKVTGLFPIVVEPRDVGGDRRLLLAYHPERQDEWFPAQPYEDLGERASLYFAGAWAGLDEEALKALQSDGKDTLRILAFSAHARTLLDELPERKSGPWDDLEIDPATKGKRTRGAMAVLPKIGKDVTAEVAGQDADLGLPRAPYRAELLALLGGERKRSTLVVGPPGAGKSTLVRRMVADVVREEGYAVHRNFDRVTAFYRISGRNLIAGMSRVGDWEQRCVEVANDVRERKVVLLVTDLHHFARIGRARDSDRALSDFFRGPVGRGDIVMVGECTPEQLRRIEDEDPAFAAAFVRVHVAPAPPTEAFRMMLSAARHIEVEGAVAIDPLAYETILEVGGALHSARALPGRAIDLLKTIAESATGAAGDKATAANDGVRTIGPADVIEHLSRQTGLPPALLSPDEPLSVDEVRRALGEQVFGQPRAVAEAADLVVRIRAGLTDPARPYAVYLFTGPTGTGKTELAKVLARYLYGAASRLVRFDMSELSGPDAVPRLVGDAWEPHGILVRAGIAQPFSAVLLDEIEKAHPRVLNLLLQLFDDGRLTDAAGNTADFTHAVIVMTSNLGARRQPAVGFDEAPDAREHDVARAVRDFFPPELFNRIDAVVPFSPLPADVAAFVTEKELARLLARPGIAERDVFVQVGEGAVARIAERALTAEDGARSLKKFLDDRVGSLLVEQIARAPDALSIVHIEDDEGHGLRVRTQALVEARPVVSRFPLSELLEESIEELRERLPGAVAVLDRVAAGDGVARLSELLVHHLREHHSGRRSDGEVLYNVDRMRANVGDLRARIEHLLVMSRDLAHEALEREHEPPHHHWRHRVEFGRGLRWEAFSCLAEVHALARAIAKVDDPWQNAVAIDLAPLGRAPTLLGWMARAYARARGEVDAIAWTAGGARHEGPASRLDAVLAGPLDRLTLRIVGPCVRDFFELETGTHVYRPYATQPELIQLIVSPASETAEKAFTGPALPIVRTIAFDPPPQGRPPAPLALEDYVLGLTHEARVREPYEALLPLWLARLSREDA